MNSNYFLDYIKEDMYDIPVTNQVDNGEFMQSLYLPGSYPVSAEVDVDVLLLITRSEIQTIEQPITGNQWDQYQWGGNSSETEDSEYQKELEACLRANTPPDTGSDTGSGPSADRWSLSPCDGGLPIVSEGSSDTIVPGHQIQFLTSHPEKPPSDQSSLMGGQDSSRNFREEIQPKERSQPAVMEPDSTVPPHPALDAVSDGVASTCDSRLRKRPLKGGAHSPLKGRRLMSSPSAPNAVTIQTLPSEPLALRRTRGHPREQVYPTTSDSGPAEVPGQIPPPALPTISHISDEGVLRKRPIPNQLRSPSPPSPIERSTSRALRQTGCRNQRQPSGMAAISKISEVPPSGTMDDGEQIPQKPIMCLSVRKGPPQDEWLSPESSSYRGRERQHDESDLEGGQKLEARLMEWGFVRRGKILHCPCGKTFSRRWDARRHWMNASIHKAERQKLGDFSDSIKYRCPGCNEVLSRKDSLQRHKTKCGLRKKRQNKGDWNPNAVRFTT